MEMLREVEGVVFGPESATWQAVTDAFMESTIQVEGIVPSTMSALTIAASELGTFLDPRNREMLDVLNHLWDGQSVPWTRRTRKDGATEIPNPWLNFLGCTTPGWIEENFPDYAVKGGFTSRTIFVYADKKRKLVPYPKLNMDASGNEFKILRQHLVNELRTIAKIKGEYTLTDSALEWGAEWYEKHWTTESKDLDPDTHGSYIARKQTHIHKTAMVLAAVEHDELFLEAKNLQQAEKLVSSLEYSLPKVFSHIVDNRDAQNTAHIIRLVQRYPAGVSKRTLWRKVITQMSQMEFNLAINGAIAADFIIEYAVSNEPFFKPFAAAE